MLLFYFLAFFLTMQWLSCKPAGTSSNSQIALLANVDEDLPLTPSNGGKSIDGSSLRSGDLIFTSANSTVSRLIRRFTGGGAASHVAMVTNDINGAVFIIEAISDGVRKISLTTLLSENTNAVAFRYPSLTLGQVSNIVAYLDERVGAPYDYFGAFKSAKFRLNNKNILVDYGQYKTDKTYCSKLIIEAFEGINISLARLTGGWSTPNDLVTLSWTDNLLYIGHLKYTP